MAFLLEILSSVDGLTDWSAWFTERFHYIGPFAVLFLCGVGLPIPEEVTLIASGLLVYRGEVEFLPITAVCAAAILLGDAVPYSLGRRYGLAALRIRWVSKVLHPERLALLERRFAEHGSWVVFTCRFLPGIRIPGYFLAGTMRMGFLRFIVLDSLGVLISVPVSIWLGVWFGGSVETLHQRMADLHLLLAFLLLSVILIVLVRVRVRRRARRAEESNESGAAPEGGEEPRADS